METRSYQGRHCYHHPAVGREALDQSERLGITAGFLTTFPKVASTSAIVGMTRGPVFGALSHSRIAISSKIRYSASSSVLPVGSRFRTGISFSISSYIKELKFSPDILFDFVLRLPGSNISATTRRLTTTLGHQSSIVSPKIPRSPPYRSAVRTDTLDDGSTPSAPTVKGKDQDSQYDVERWTGRVLGPATEQGHAACRAAHRG